MFYCGVGFFFAFSLFSDKYIARGILWLNNFFVLSPPNSTPSPQLYNSQIGVFLKVFNKLIVTLLS